MTDTLRASAERRQEMHQPGDADGPEICACCMAFWPCEDYRLAQNDLAILDNALRFDHGFSDAPGPDDVLIYDPKPDPEEAS